MKWSANMPENGLRLHRCCFTGHRPEKLRFSESEICSLLDEEIKNAIEAGYTTFISGMAKGVDLWAAEIVLKYRMDNSEIKLICAVPYKGFGLHWTDGWTQRFSAVLSQADLVKYICPGYSPACFQIRNEWMVNHSNRIIIAYNGEKGGTKNTIDYAQNHSECECVFLPMER
jgi:uncharacterized phage-like protein YoqJ